VTEVAPKQVLVPPAEFQVPPHVRVPPLSSKISPRTRKLQCGVKSWIK
jgi:hypothetical protein